jgi:hypothetical protein
MRMPGLNAEASLYTSKGRYRAATVAHPNVPQGIVTPSQDVVWRECRPWEVRRCGEQRSYCLQHGRWWITDPRELEIACEQEYQGCIDSCTIIWES